MFKSVKEQLANVSRDENHYPEEPGGLHVTTIGLQCNQGGITNSLTNLVATVGSEEVWLNQLPHASTKNINDKQTKCLERRKFVH